ncbi:MAG TPA: MerR family transcriptional regulator [Gammaproteobacteria bacterium]|nr:MerR family transcriptional regulator [Gammaproteobacteria bacterium]
MAKPITETTPEATDLYPIRTVCSITGLNPVTLRAWERRYGLIKPRRTPKGHRLYTQFDIDRINEAVRLLDRGIPISQVRQILDHRQEQGAVQKETAGHWVRHIDDMLHAIGMFDEHRLDALYNEALSLYPVDTVTRYLMIPLLHELGLRWASAEGSIAEEHYFGVFLRNKLGARFHHLRVPQTGPRLLAACLPRESHEIGLLIFSLMAKIHGCSIVLLGANMPLTELPRAARRARCHAIVLAGSKGYDYPQLPPELKAAVLESPVPVFVGGGYSVHARDVIAAAEAIPLGEDIPHAIKYIERVLGES